MARRKSSIPSALRVRDNQRRFRARQKEYIEELKQRLAEYENRDSIATREIQLAARKVAKENHLLRHLLRHKGASDDEVRVFIRSFEYDHCVEEPVGEPKSRLLDYFTAEEILISRATGDDVEIHSSTSAVQTTVIDPTDRELSAGACNPVEEYSGLETSCIEAASILAVLRGHGDSELALQELGCSGSSDCRIRNTNLLEVMDNEGSSSQIECNY